MKKLLIYILVTLSAMAAFSAHGEPVSIKARLDSAHLIMGKQGMLRVEVVKNRGTSGYFPMFADGDNRPYVGLNGDTIELSRRFTSDTVELGSGRTQINYQIPLQAFDSGFYYLPPIQYVAGVDTVESNRVALKVLPVAAKADDEIEGYTSVADAPEGSWSDRIPNFLYYYWWLILLIILVVAAVVWGVIRYHRHGRILPGTKPQLPPYEAARQALDRLKSRQLWQQGQVEQYFVELTDILRTYISRRFDVSAPEMTTQQFLTEAAENPVLAPYAPELHRLLTLADLVKFARTQSLPDENTEAFRIVSDFVDTTRPAEKAEKESAADAADNAAKQPAPKQRKEAKS